MEGRFHRRFIALPLWGLMHGGAYFRNFSVCFYVLNLGQSQSTQTDEFSQNVLEKRGHGPAFFTSSSQSSMEATTANKLKHLQIICGHFYLLNNNFYYVLIYENSVKQFTPCPGIEKIDNIKIKRNVSLFSSTYLSSFYCSPLPIFSFLHGSELPLGVVKSKCMWVICC